MTIMHEKIFECIGLELKINDFLFYDNGELSAASEAFRIHRGALWILN